MTIRNEIAKHVWYKIGNGRNVSMWFDNWCEVGPLFKIITSRHLYDARFARDMVVADMISDGNWNWPNEWDQTYLMVRHIQTPTLRNDENDCILWKNKEGRCCKFSIKEVYKVLDTTVNEVKWSKLVWFSQCIPKQSFILWMAIQGKLMM